MDLRDKIAEAYGRLGTISGTARAVNADRETVRKHLRALNLYDDKPMYAGRVSTFQRTTRPLPKKGEVKRYLLTSAQNNTKVNQRVWDNGLSLAEYYGAEVLVGTLTYNKASYGAKATKRGRGPQASDREEVWYDPEIEPYICDDQVEIVPGLVWCGEMNILPTAVKPLQGLEIYTGDKSSVFPHVKLQMQAIPTGKSEPTRFTYTTGTVTKRNYIAKKEGLKAEFHHVYGFLLVEVDSKGSWFVRQVISTDKGVMCDLDVMVDEAGEITVDNRVAAITWGDIHTAALDPTVKKLAWDGADEHLSMIDALCPTYQFMHDILDFRSRNGHTQKKNLIHDRFKAWVEGNDSVEEEIRGVAELLVDTSRPWCKTVVVDSNHDNFMKEWLRIGDYKQDPINAIYFLETQLAVYKSIAEDPKRHFNILAWAVDRLMGGMRPDWLQFSDEDESFVVKGIEQGMHGHLGPNGSRPSDNGLARMGRRANVGHRHSPGIFEGLWTAGLCGENDQGYNKGPSSWSPSHIVTYHNGKRAIITMRDGKWRV